MNKVKLTVLMAVYNGGEFLKDSIQSVLNQTYQDFEFLILDDCSTDNSVEIINSFSDSRIVIYSNEKNMGQTKSLTLGLNHARGEYIARIDADDIAFPLWLKAQINFIERNPEVVVASANAIVIDENTKIRRKYLVPSKKEEILLRSLMASPINHVVSIMRKDILVQYGGYDDQYRIIADYGLWSALLRNGKNITSSNKVLMAIRVHSKSLSLINGNEKYIDALCSIMHENINHLTTVNFDKEEVVFLCKASYATHLLSDDEFDKTILILEKIYSHLLLKGEDDSPVIENCLKGQFFSICLKRIKVFISRGDYRKVRKISFIVLKRWGANIYFLSFYLLSFFGMIFLKKILSIFEGVRAFVTNVKFFRIFKVCRMK